MDARDEVKITEHAIREAVVAAAKRLKENTGLDIQTVNITVHINVLDVGTYSDVHGTDIGTVRITVS